MTKNDKDNEMAGHIEEESIVEPQNRKRARVTKEKATKQHVLGKSSSLAALACALCINAFASDGTVLKKPIRGGSLDG